MVTITHAKITGAPADSTSLVDGPAWDAAHVMTNLQASDVHGFRTSVAEPCPPGTEFLDAETGPPKSPPETTKQTVDQGPKILPAS